MSDNNSSAFWTNTIALVAAFGGIPALIAATVWFKEYRANQPSVVDVVLNLRQDMNYLETRRKLISAGWRPLEKQKTSAEFETVSTYRFNGAGLPEVQECMPTGLGLCVGTFQLEDGRTLDVTIKQGKDGPLLATWSTNFFIPTPQEPLDAVGQLRPGLPYREVRQFLETEGWIASFGNPMHGNPTLPEELQDFGRQFPSARNCQIDNGVIETCTFMLYTSGERTLTITTGVNKKYANAYELPILYWSLE